MPFSTTFGRGPCSFGYQSGGANWSSICACVYAFVLPGSFFGTFCGSAAGGFLSGLGNAHSSLPAACPYAPAANTRAAPATRPDKQIDFFIADLPRILYRG